MRGLLAAVAAIALTIVCWGNYGPLMHEGQHGMGHSSLRPFICVGLAYFMIAVVVPIIVLRTRGEKGSWTVNGIVWSLVAGGLGAIGAMGIIMAFKFRGSPVYVMPLVFGCAPVVNTLVTMAMSRTFKQAGFLFIAGIVAVAVGAAGVLTLKPRATNISVIRQPESEVVTVVQKRFEDGATVESTWTADNIEDLEAKHPLAYRLYLRTLPPTPAQWTTILLSIAMTALCWGCYGPILHKGQMKMSGSRLRPFLCVGLAYFGIAVIVPAVALSVWSESGSWFPNGHIGGFAWSVGAGAAGALGALGIIMAFNFGGKPIFIMPLVFGGAPVVNTFTTIVAEGTYGQVTPGFYASVLVVIVGAIAVLLFAPKGQPPPKSKPDEQAKEKAEASSHVE